MSHDRWAVGNNVDLLRTQPLIFCERLVVRSYELEMLETCFEYPRLEALIAVFVGLLQPKLRVRNLAPS
jgi:hypothetical protein